MSDITFPISRMQPERYMRFGGVSGFEVVPSLFEEDTTKSVREKAHLLGESLSQAPQVLPEKIREVDALVARAQSKDIPKDISKDTWKVRSTTRFEILSGFYNISNLMAVQEFLQHNPALVKLLFEALPKVKEAWGPETSSTLEVLEDPEDESLSLVVRISSKNPEPYEALDSFDEQWWLGKVALSDGLLNFSIQEK